MALGRHSNAPPKQTNTHQIELREPLVNKLAEGTAAAPSLRRALLAALGCLVMASQPRPAMACHSEWMLLANPLAYQACLASHAPLPPQKLNTQGTGAGPREPGQTKAGLQPTKSPPKLDMKAIDCWNRGPNWSWDWQYRICRPKMVQLGKERGPVKPIPRHQINPNLGKRF